MNKVLVAAGIVLILLLGCKDDDVPATPVRELWPRGSYPVPSPVDARVLFLQEEEPAGLYVLNNGAAEHLNPSGPPVRPDYAWSRDGTRIAFSSPADGIWISNPNDLDNLARISNFGSHPRFYPVESLLVFAGPEDGSENTGIWQTEPAGGSVPVRLSDRGVEPEVSPDGFRIAFLVTTGGSTGRTLIVYHRVTQAQDTVALNVLRHSWLGDSQALVYETIQNGVPEINIVRPGDGLLGVFIASGTAPAGHATTTEFVYTGISGDQLSGISHASISTAPTRISITGTNPRFAGGNRVVAQESGRLIEITY